MTEVSSDELKQYFNSKKELYRLMSMGSKIFDVVDIPVQIYLPPLTDCGLQFLREILTGAKEVNFNANKN
jgi:hypothetical protein